MTKIRGAINEHYRPYITLRVEGIRNHVVFFVDTGFNGNGSVIMPPHTLPRGIETIGTRRVYLGDNSYVMADICYFGIELLGEWKNPMVHIVEGAVPTVGNYALRGLELICNFDNMTVIIQRPVY